VTLFLSVSKVVFTVHINNDHKQQNTTYNKLQVSHLVQNRIMYNVS